MLRACQKSRKLTSRIKHLSVLTGAIITRKNKGAVIMTILEKMLKVRSDLIENDREKAMKALISKLHYEVASLVSSGDTFTLFNNELDITSFCQEQNIDIRAMKWLIEAMSNEGLLMLGKMSVLLTPLGVQKLCLS